MGAQGPGTKGVFEFDTAAQLSEPRGPHRIHAGAGRKLPATVDSVRSSTVGKIEKLSLERMPQVPQVRQVRQGSGGVFA